MYSLTSFKQEAGIRFSLLLTTLMSLPVLTLLFHKYTKNIKPIGSSLRLCPQGQGIDIYYLKKCISCQR